jgi:hypothetical protein
MAAWPSSLPALEAAVQESRQSSVIRTPMETGPSKVRRRFSAATRFIVGTMVLNATQRSALDSFFSTTLSEGALEFTFSDPVDDTEQSVRFTAEPSYATIRGGSASDRLWRATLQLEILP